MNAMQENIVKYVFLLLTIENKIPAILYSKNAIAISIENNNNMSINIIAGARIFIFYSC